MDLREVVNKYLRRLKDGDDCFDEFFNRTSCYIEFIARKYLYDKSHAGDVIIETYTTVWRNLSKFDENRNGYALICKIAKNAALKCNERERYHVDESAAAVDAGTKIEYGPSNDTEEIIDLYAAIQSLPEQDRGIVEARFIYDKKLQEIADEFGVTVGTVHNRLIKCVKILKKILRKS